MLSGLEKKAAYFIKANELFSSGDKVLLAVSGGADSMALLYAMQALKVENVLNVELFCAHINHRLRGAEADLDEEFVIAQAAKLKLVVATERLDVREFAGRNKLSIETAARQLRIRSLVDIAGANGCDAIATAHHKNDNAETILQRLIRGTGFRGLGGIWPARIFAEEFKFVRPLLCVGRDEIIEYLRKRDLKWRQDHTNADCTYRRNYIRHRLFPALQQDCSGSLVEQLYKLSESARRFYSLVCASADNVWPKLTDFAGETITLDLKTFLTQPQSVKIELIRRSLVNIGCGERELTQRHYEKILKLTQQNVSGKKIELPGGFVARRQYGSLVFAPSEKTDIGMQIGESVRLQIPGKTQFGQFAIEATILEEKTHVTRGAKYLDSVVVKQSNVECFDLDKIELPLVVRFRQPGDKFVPLGLGREKKVGKFLTAAKVPHDVRDKILIVTDGEKVIWVRPVRMSERAKVTDKTKKILQLEITEAVK